MALNKKLLATRLLPAGAVVASGGIYASASNTSSHRLQSKRPNRFAPFAEDADSTYQQSAASIIKPVSHDDIGVNPHDVDLSRSQFAPLNFAKIPHYQSSLSRSNAAPIAAFSIALKDLTTQLSHKKDPLIYLQSAFFFNEHNPKLNNLADSVKQQELVTDYFINIEKLIAFNFVAITPVFIQVPSLNLSIEVSLKISFDQSAKSFIFCLEEKNQANPSYLSTTNSSVVLSVVFQEGLVRHHPDSSDLWKEIHTSALDSEHASADTLIKQINSFVSAPKSNLDTGFAKLRNKEWLYPMFKSGGFTPSTDPQTASPSYYFEKGVDTSFPRLLSNPEDMLTMSDADKKKEQSIFSSISINPHKIGGYIKDDLAKPAREVEVKNNLIDCSDNSKTPNIKKLCRITLKGKTINISEFPHLKADGKTEHMIDTRILGERLKRGELVPAFEYDVATPANNIHPLIADVMYKYYKNENLESIPNAPAYAPYWSLPELHKSFLQSIFENKDKSKTTATAPATPQVAVASSTNTEPTPTFPQYFVRAGDFRTWGDVPKLGTSPKLDGHYSLTKEANLETKHKFTLKILKKDWQQYLVENPTIIPTNADEEIRKQTKTGVQITFPISLEFIDPFSKRRWSYSFNYAHEYLLSNLKNSNILKNQESIIDLSAIHKEHVGWRFWGVTHLHINPYLTVSANMDENKNLVFEYHFNIKRFISSMNSNCDARDWDHTKENPPHIYWNANLKKYVYLCRMHEKIPPLFSFAINSEPSVLGFKYVDRNADVAQNDYLKADKLDERNIIYDRVLIGHERQSKNFAQLKPIVKDIEEASQEAKVTTGWFSNSQDQWLGLFGIIPTPTQSSSSFASTAPTTSTPNTDWLDFEAGKLADEDEIEITIQSLDEDESGLVINAKHPFSTKLTVFGNETVSESDTSTRSKKSIDNQSYTWVHKDIDPHQVNELNLTAPVKFRMKYKFFKSSSAEKPTWIPVRSVISYNSSMKYDSSKDNLDEVSTYIMKKDKDLTTSEVKGPKDSNAQITDWSKDTTTLNKIKGNEKAFAFLNYGFFIYATDTSGAKTLKLKTKLYGAAYADAPNSNSTQNTYGAEGNAGLALHEIKIIKAPKKSS